ncbi:MAG: acetylornithine transaminase [Betaproteobacteria bacterium]|jgi:acetylornithine/N-succinyldiaminopimelate aminotransferase|nr:acetylornithine transaminase [Betaproteobacteria bacterium]MDH5342713.1 acetylornithine transaminase [Betaproteobacteria bacterium]
MSHVMNTYGRLPVTFERGEGVWLWDTEGKRYLDALAGVAVCGLGHAHPRFTAALQAQIGKLVHTSNIYGIALQEQLADRLAALSGMDNVFFCNSGCEANEAAIKLARLYGHQKGIEAPAIVVMEHAFHGRTMATLSATGSRKVQAGFEPLVSGFVRVPYDDLEAVRRVAENNRSVVAVLVELVQGEGGVNICHDGYLRGLREICDANGWLLMLDEVQTGIGRTGKWFAFQHSGVKPDVMPLAKGLGNGVPIGACLAAGAAAQLFKPGHHGSTFGGNPLACAAALATLAIIEDDKLMQNAVMIGDFIRAQIGEKLAGLSGVREIRGIGMMTGIELDKPCKGIVEKALHAGLLINVTADNVIRLVPPLIYTREDAQHLVDNLVPLIKDELVKQAAPQSAAA